jgi:hypothetical protein
MSVFTKEGLALIQVEEGVTERLCDGAITGTAAPDLKTSFDL